MLTYSDALQTILGVATRRSRRLELEAVQLEASLCRYAGADINALDPNPRFDNAAMDGFLLRSAETSAAQASAPVLLTLVDSLAAGAKPFETQAGRATCIEIMTGAPVENFAGYDAVLALEKVSELRSVGGKLEAISIAAPVFPGENIRRLGQDFESGQVLVTKGTRIEPQQLMALAMSGQTRLQVLRPVRIAVLSTGSELVSWNSPALEKYQIRNSTQPLLCAALRASGAEISYCGIVPDDALRLRSAVEEALITAPDVLITCGGVSAGRLDLVPPILKEMGALIHLHKVAVRPGKPLLFGEWPAGGPVVFGLPGNPLAVAAATRFFVGPYLRALNGAADERPQILPLTQDLKKAPGLTCFLHGVTEGAGVQAPGGQASFKIGPFLQADGWIVAAGEPALLKRGESVAWYPLW